MNNTLINIANTGDSFEEKFDNPELSRTLTTLNGIKIHYTKEQVEKVFLDLHAFHVVIYEINKDLGLNCITANNNNFGFSPAYHGGMVTSHGIAIKLTNDLPAQLITPFGSLNIENTCSLTINQTQVRIASTLVSTIKNEFLTYKCGDLESVFAIGASEYYEKMQPQMNTVGYNNIKCASSFFDYQDKYNAWMNSTKKAEETLNATQTKYVSALKEAQETYTYYKNPITTGLKSAVVDLAGGIGIALYLRSKGVEPNHYTPKKDDWVLDANGYKNIIISATILKEGVHVLLAKGSQNIPYFDDAFNIAAITGIAIGATCFGITVTPTILITAGITLVAINYLGASDYKSYEAPIFSLETAGEFALNVGIKLGINHLLSKSLPNVSPIIDTTHPKDSIPACDRGISEVVRNAKSSNVDAVTIMNNFPVSKFIQESTGNPGAKGVIMSVTNKGTTIIKDEAPGLISYIGNKFFAGLKAVYETVIGTTESTSENTLPENDNSSTNEDPVKVVNASFSESNITLAGNNITQEHSNDSQ